MFEINRTKIKGVCQSGRKVVTHNSKCEFVSKVCFLRSGKDVYMTNKVIRDIIEASNVTHNICNGGIKVFTYFKVLLMYLRQITLRIVGYHFSS